MNQHDHSIVVLTGAGISAESGIRTFRDSDGLWEDHDIEEIATYQAYLDNPDKVLGFYNDRCDDLHKGVQPNSAHYALAAFEQAHGGEFLLVTQNVDNLHERAGSQNLRHMHGELNKVRCERCHQIYACSEALSARTRCTQCNTAGAVRPHIVWFGEMPHFMDEISLALSECDVFIAIGTSGNVYPAAGFVEMAAHAGAHTVELNLEPSLSNSMFAEHHYGPATQVVPAFFDLIHAPI